VSASAVGLRERGKQRRIERILGAALELLRSEPDEPLTVERIAARAEVAPATVFNLVGTRERIWAALANRAFASLEEVSERTGGDPHERARAMADAVMKTVIADAAVFRALLSDWSQSGKVLDRDLTQDLVACLHEAGFTPPQVDVERLAALVGTGFNGACHQWAAGLISDRELRRRSRDLVDLAFVAARGAAADPDPPWRLSRS
jgi:AcrR family transcriptional regulator